MLLITWLRVPAFIALLLGSVAVGLAARMPLADIPRAFQQGTGDTLGFVALVIGLGTVIGKLLAESGGAVVVSRALISALGERRMDWAMLLSGFLIGLPVFFQVGLVLLAPVLFTVTNQTGLPLVRLGIPLVAGLSAAHGLVPPHPGPLAAIERLGADTGRTLFYSLIVSLPVALVSGPLVGRLVSRRVHVKPGAIAEQFKGEIGSHRAPSLTTTVVTILMPVLLMLLAALVQTTMADGVVRRLDRVRRQPARCDGAGDAAGHDHVRKGVRLLSRSPAQTRRRLAAADRRRAARRRCGRRLRARAGDGGS